MVLGPAHRLHAFAGGNTARAWAYYRSGYYYAAKRQRANVDSLSRRDLIARNPNVTEFRRLCTERGMVTLRADGLKKAVVGKTSVEEVLRATEATI